MFSPGALIVFAILLILSAIAHQLPLFLLSLTLLGAAGLSRLWERYCLVGLEYRRRFSTDRAAFGETIDLEIEIVNRKLLPLAWLEIEDEIPRELPPARGTIFHSHKATRSLISSLLALRPYERVRRHYPLPCTVRGEHVFGPVCLRTGDLFGAVSRELTDERTDILIVYPRVVPLTALGLPAHHPLGDQRLRSWLFEDPNRPAGVRDYHPGDSLRRIHWPASARTQRLQVRIFEPTTRHTIALFLNLKSTPGDWWGLEYDPDVLELTITTAASVGVWAIEQGYAVGLWTNGMHRLGRLHVALAPGRAPDQRDRLLEALGRLQPIPVRPFEQTLAQDSRHLPYGTTIVAISAVLTPPIAAALRALRHRGYPVTLITTGRQPVTAALDGIVIRRVGPPDAWRTVTELVPAVG
ncbi:MAG TPA: DUF58 domain-containing protein [Chloroflexota bacterium]|nr:DUF58 domain-containing protein [Chloroflexota bacterium]